jgi:peptide/nickel transport system substrate-binding protein
MLFTVALLSLLLLAGCQNSAETGADTSNRIVYGLTLSPSGFDPHINQSSEIGIVLRQVYDTLIYRDPASGGFTAGLAESWNVSADQTIYTFTLRQGVTFHDGTPFNAQAVAANLNRIVNPETRSQNAIFLLGSYSGYEIIDDYTIALSFSTPYAPLLDGLAQVYLGMASPTALEAYPSERYQFRQVGTGPFVFIEYIPDERLILRRNPNYAWAPSFYQAPTSEALDEIEFRFFTDPALRIAALEQGATQIIGELPPADARVVVGSAQIQVTQTVIPGQPEQFIFNTQRFPTDNLSIRQALIHGADRGGIVNTLYQGFSTVAEGPLTPGVQFYDSASLQTYAFDVRQARALISSQGYIDSDNNGFWDAQGGDLTVKMLVPPWGEFRQMAQLLRDQWQAIGVQVELDPVPDFPTLLSRVAEGDYNLVAFNSYGVDPSFLSAYFTTDGIRNFANISNPELDALIGEAVRQLAPDLRAQAWSQIQRYITREALILPIRVRVNLNGSTERIDGLRFDPYGWFPLLYNVRSR